MRILPTTLSQLDAIAIRGVLLSETEAEYCSHYLDAVDAKLIQDKGLANKLRPLASQFLREKLERNPDFIWRHDGSFEDILRELRAEHDCVAA